MPRHPTLGPLVAALLASGCASLPPPAQQAPGPVRAQVVAEAERLLGIPYRYGGSSESGLDCSGLVQLSYARAGVALPRTTREQYRSAEPLPRAQPGDLLFFDIDRSGVSHVGIYVGNGEMIHASSGTAQVRRARVDIPYWRQRLITAAMPKDCPGAC